MSLTTQAAAFKNQGGIFCINHVVLLYAAAYDVHMGLLDALRSLTGPKAPRLATPEAGAPVVEVGHLEVHTAGTLLIVVTDSSGAAALREVALAAEPAWLADAPTRVFFSPSPRPEVPVRDPKKGWAIPLDPDTRAALLETLRAEPGDYELSKTLAISVE